MTSPFRLGDTVTYRARRSGLPTWDGTVVDIIGSRSEPNLVRVYWRYPLGKVSDHRPELVRRV